MKGAVSMLEGEVKLRVCMEEDESTLEKDCKGRN